jgi:hypothetical protein
MSLDPEFIRKVQEKKAKREAMEQKYASPAPRAARKGTAAGESKGGGRRASGPVYRSVSMLSGHEVVITGDDAKKRAQKAEFNG